jgi:hypothetical protein
MPKHTATVTPQARRCRCPTTRSEPPLAPAAGLPVAYPTVLISAAKVTVDAAPSTPEEVQEHVIARAENGETFTHEQITAAWPQKRGRGWTRFSTT